MCAEYFLAILPEKWDRHFDLTKRMPDVAEGEGKWEVVFDKYEDGNDLITHSTFTDRGSSLFHWICLKNSNNLARTS